MTLSNGSRAAGGQSRSARSLRQLRLNLLVHLDGFRSAPGSYLRAIFWRIRGLKLRSRNTLSPLITRSRHAYDLWLLNEEGVAPHHASLEPSKTAEAMTILPVIEYSGDQKALFITIDSLRAAGCEGPVVVVQLAPEAPHPLPPGTNQDLIVCRGVRDFRCALQQISPSWIMPMLAGDQLSTHAPSAYASALGNGQANVAYADDDLVDTRGKRHAPYFKPDWNAELFLHQDYLSFASIVHGRFGLACNTWQSIAWAQSILAEALADPSVQIVHIPQVLHHRANRNKVMTKRGPAEPLISSFPPITIIVPTRNQLKLLKTCLDGVERTAYPNIRCIVIDNDSDDPDTLKYLSSLKSDKYSCLKYPGPFNYSKINNHAVKLSESNFICFLNNDVEIIEDNWLTFLIAQAMRPDVGAVGAKLLYPDQTIQHAGIVLGVGGAAGHAHRFSPNADSGYFDRPHLPQYVSAVTGACLVVNKDHFERVNGFDEVDFPVAFNDVDLCLKLAGMGLHNVYEPRAVLIHHESCSRGSDLLKHNRARFGAELSSLKRKWRTDEIRDPWHNPNLSRLTEQFVIDLL